MVTNATEILQASSATSAIGRLIDRWIFMLMAALFVAVAEYDSERPLSGTVSVS